MDYHRPVLAGEVIEFLQIKPGGIYLDCTLGDGGHSLKVLEKGGDILGIDQDPEAIERARQRFEKAGWARHRYRVVRGNFRNLKQLVGEEDLKRGFEGVVFDLGVSSRQFDTPERGFSFAKQGVLDMRMDPELGVSALGLVNGLNKGELEKLFWMYGDFKNRKVTEAIVRAREKGRIETTTELASIIEKAGGWSRGKIHPATLIFQALRIAVNDEINSLKEALPQSLEVIKTNGRILVISFHSHEDRIVKNMFRKWESDGLGQVIGADFKRKGGIIVPSLEEVRSNPRSRSAKMRIFEKI